MMDFKEIYHYSAFIPILRKQYNKTWSLFYAWAQFVNHFTKSFDSIQIFTIALLSTGLRNGHNKVWYQWLRSYWRMWKSSIKKTIWKQFKISIPVLKSWLRPTKNKQNGSHTLLLILTFNFWTSWKLYSPKREKKSGS